MGQEIEIIIEADGSVTIDAKNFVGAECKRFTAALEADLGEVAKVTEKPEMHQARTAPRKVSR